MDLNIKIEKLFRILFNELLDAKAELRYQNSVLTALGKHLNLPADFLSDALRSEFVAKYRNGFVQEFSSLLQAESEDFQDFLSSLFD